MFQHSVYPEAEFIPLLSKDIKSKNANNRLVMPISNRSLEFKKNLENFLQWAIETFNDCRFWLSGPLQRYNISAEIVTSRTLKLWLDCNIEIGSKFENEIANTALREANIIADELEEKTYGRIIKLLSRYTCDENFFMRQEHAIFPHVTKWEKQSTSQFYEIIPWKYLIDITKTLYVKSKKIFEEELIKDSDFKNQFDALVRKFSLIRLKSQYNKLSDKELLVLLSKFKKQNNFIDSEKIISLSKIGRQRIIDSLVEIDCCHFKNIYINATEAFLNEELPLLIMECEKAKRHFHKTGGVTFIAYPTTPNSLGEGMFKFGAIEMLMRIFGDYRSWLNWIDTSDQIINTS